MRHDAISAFTRLVAGLLMLAGTPTSVLAITAPPRSDAAPAAATLTNWYVNAATGNDGFTCLSTGQPCQTITAAIGKASDGDTINIAAGVHVESGIVVDKSLTLQGAGATQTIIDGAQANRVLRMENPATLRDLTVRNGRLNITSGAYLDNSGGGILAMADVTLQNVIVTGNSVGGNGSGGGILGLSRLHIIDSQILSNTSATVGGGIWKQGAGPLYITATLLSGNIALGQEGAALYTSSPSSLVGAAVTTNSAGTFAGGIASFSTLDLNRVTLSGNTAQAGAAITMLSGVLTMTNVTISANAASNNTGGVHVSDPGIPVRIQNSTIAYNTSAGGGNVASGVSSSGTVRVVNSIFANNGARNCSSSSGSWTSEGNNLSTDNSCGFFQTGDYSQVAALLAPLADNGGETQTHALLPGSYAIDGGNNATCEAVDQRMVSRPFDGDGVNGAVCDMGAYETRQQVSITDGSVREGSAGSSTLVFTVTLSPAASGATTVNYSTAGGSATSGSDFTPASGTLTFNTGESVKTISVTVTADTTDEPDESFSLQLDGFSGDVSDGNATGTIIDDDGLPTLALSDATVLEGNSGQRSAVFTVTLSPAHDTQVSVSYNTTDGSANTPGDYTTLAGQLTFAPGQTSRTLTVTVKGDRIDEGASETFSMTLSAPVNAQIGDGAGSGTITDDDIAQLSITNTPPAAEGNLGLTAVNVTVTLSTAASFPISVDYVVSAPGSSDTATADVDFVAESGTVSFLPGETVKTITVHVIGDRTQEGDEVVMVTLANGTVGISGSVTFVTISNDDTSTGVNVLLPYVAR